MGSQNSHEGGQKSLLLRIFQLTKWNVDSDFNRAVSQDVYPKKMKIGWDSVMMQIYM